MTTPDRECFTDFALQEYVQGRLDSAIRLELEHHTATCTQCRAALQEFQTEAALLHAALSSATASTEEVDINDETLALYCTGALEAGEAIAVETALSRNPGLLQRLIALTRETTAVRSSETADDVVGTPQPAGQILRMPKRSARPVVVSLERRAGGGRAG